MPVVKPKVPTSKPTIKAKPMSVNEKAQSTAAKKLDAERNAYAKKNGGNWPSDKQLMKSRKGM